MRTLLTCSLLLWTALANAQVINPYRFAPSSSLNTGLAAYYRFEGPEGGTQTDAKLTGTKRDLSATGTPMKVGGRVGTAMANIATGSTYYSVADNADLSVGDIQFTFVLWVYLAAKPASQLGVFNKYRSGDGNREYRLYWDNVADRFTWVVSSTGGGVSATAVANTLGAPVTNTWYMLRCGHDSVTNQIFIGADTGAADTANITTGVFDGASPFEVGSSLNGGSSPINGGIDELGLWKRLLTSDELTALYNAGNGITCCPFFAAGATVDSPQPYQVFQRDGSNQGTITISGSLGVAGTHDVEARWNNQDGAWTTIATGVSGVYSGTLAGQSMGQGMLEVRLKDMPSIWSSVPYVGVGDVFIIAGQSNASGQGTNNQLYTGTPPAGLFRNSYWAAALTDPTDSIVNQVDAVSKDGPSATGSCWPLLANHYSTNQTCPIMFVPCAITSTSITQWQPSGGSTNRASLYGSMVWRAKYMVGGARAILWWQGETDALNNMSQATYYQNFTNFTYNAFTDIGCKTMPCKLQNSSILNDAQENNIRAAVGQAWSGDSNTLTGPDFSDIGSDDNYHLKTDAHLETAAGRWWDAIKAAFSW